MTASLHSASRTSQTSLWAARILGALDVLFLLFDAFGKWTRPQPVVDAFAMLGQPLAQAPTIGTILFVLVVLYIVPRTRFLAAILLTGYLGGAVAIQMRAATPAFETLFPIVMGILVWMPLYLTDERVRSIV
jgi:hypothetical protein